MNLNRTQKWLIVASAIAIALTLLCSQVYLATKNNNLQTIDVIRGSAPPIWDRYLPATTRQRSFLGDLEASVAVNTARHCV